MGQGKLCPDSAFEINLYLNPKKKLFRTNWTLEIWCQSVPATCCLVHVTLSQGMSQNAVKQLKVKMLAENCGEVSFKEDVLKRKDEQILRGAWNAHFRAFGNKFSYFTKYLKF